MALSIAFIDAGRSSVSTTSTPGSSSSASARRAARPLRVARHGSPRPCPVWRIAHRRGPVSVTAPARGHALVAVLVDRWRIGVGRRASPSGSRWPSPSQTTSPPSTAAAPAQEQRRAHAGHVGVEVARSRGPAGWRARAPGTTASPPRTGRPRTAVAPRRPRPGASPCELASYVLSATAGHDRRHQHDADPVADRERGLVERRRGRGQAARDAREDDRRPHGRADDEPGADQQQRQDEQHVAGRRPGQQRDSRGCRGPR